MRAVILMSTYNGQEFIGAQLDSILAQKGVVDLNIYIRDDGSSDNTLKIIKDYQNKFDKIFLECGANIGPCGSFFELLKNCKNIEKADIYLFSDQDDFWMPTKIQHSYETLKKISGPSLYSSVLGVVDQNLGDMRIYRHRERVKYFDPIYVNAVTGCSSAWNDEFLRIIKVPENYSDVLMHDWWLYLTAMFLGSFHYDTRPLTLYRQHAGNVIGIQSFWYKLKKLRHNAKIGSMLRIRQFLKFLIVHRISLVKAGFFNEFYEVIDSGKLIGFKASILTLKNLSIKALLSSLTFR